MPALAWNPDGIAPALEEEPRPAISTIAVEWPASDVVNSSLRLVLVVLVNSSNFLPKHLWEKGLLSWSKSDRLSKKEEEKSCTQNR